MINWFIIKLWFLWNSLLRISGKIAIYVFYQNSDDLRCLQRLETTHLKFQIPRTFFTRSFKTLEFELEKFWVTQIKLSPANRIRRLVYPIRNNYRIRSISLKRNSIQALVDISSFRKNEDSSIILYSNIHIYNSI